MIKKIKIDNNSFVTTIVIKNNYILNYLKKILSTNKKVFCIVDTNVKYI